MTEWRDRHVLVVGLGVSGEAAARFLVEQGARVRATDAGENDRLRALKAEFERLGAPVEIGGHTAACLDGVDLVVLSPGVPPSALPVRLADERAVPVISEIELAYRRCTARIAAITGTNGKTTVTHLVARLLAAGGIESITAGNIGDPLVDKAQAVGPDGVLAVELSSFQLERIERFRPEVGVLLNVTPDHMDRYASLDDYARAKMRLFENQTPGDTAVVHESVVQMGYRPAGPRVVVYGDGPRCDIRLDGEAVVSTGSGRHYELRGVWHLPGQHNVHNAMAAIAVSETFGVAREAIVGGLRAFRGLPHRLEFVDEQCGVRYINDSKGTNVDAVEKALDAIAAPVVLIAGGLDKDLEFEPLRAKVHAWVKKLVLIGQAAPKLARTFAGATDCVRAGSLDEAVQIARTTARPGDTVLLSPGCASFDMFRDYVDRGDQFKACVRTKTACAKAGET